MLLIIVIQYVGLLDFNDSRVSRDANFEDSKNRTYRLKNRVFQQVGKLKS